MKKAMISQPMKGKTREEIEAVRNEAIAILEAQGYEVINTWFPDSYEKADKSGELLNIPLWFLAQSLMKMAQCDAVYFCKGWQDTRGCLIEYEAASRYGLTCLGYVTQ